ncbi:MAG: ribonuclease P protein component [Desulfobacterales bacterium]|nr:ribonuclease P protein component [Desulfobacterales bacterium]
MKRYGFTKSDRILKHSGYSSLSQLGKTVRDQFFIIVFANGNNQRSRLGITVSKRVGNAVMRNRLKRVVREFFRLNRDLIKGHWDFNVIAKKDAADLTHHQAFLALMQLFGKMARKIDNGR